MRILLVATRDPAGRSSGRRTVLRTIVRCLTELGHDLEVAVCSRRPPVSNRIGDVRLHHVPTPGLGRIALNVALHGSRRTLSLNECLYLSPGSTAALRAIAAKARCDVVIADMIRTARLAEAVGCPFLLDLDDLLSDRYGALAKTDRMGPELLGYYRENLPVALTRPAAWLAKQVLRFEAQTLVKRELDLARRANVVALVSPIEAERFASLLGRPVVSLPMATAIPAEPVPVADSPPAGLFVGGLDYYPNLEAVRWLATDVLPVLRYSMRTEIRLDVAGYCPDRVRRELEPKGVRSLGYVSDLGTVFGRYRLFVSPLLSGAGIKTKVLEAMAAGLPVVGTTRSFEGTGAIDGEHCLVADDPVSFASAIKRLADDPAFASSVGLAGRNLVSQSFSVEAVRERWRSALATLTDQMP